METALLTASLALAAVIVVGGIGKRSNHAYKAGGRNRCAVRSCCLARVSDQGAISSYMARGSRGGLSKYNNLM